MKLIKKEIERIKRKMKIIKDNINELKEKEKMTGEDANNYILLHQKLDWYKNKIEAYEKMIKDRKKL